MIAATSSSGATVPIRAWLARYLEWLRVHNYSERTVANVSSSINIFLDWCEERGLARADEITKPILERYQRHLFHFRQKSGRPLTFRTQVGRLVRVRGLFRWLVRQNVLSANPASDLEMPRKEKRLPKHVLTVAEVERILAVPKQTDVLGLRDRAMLEVLYATGVRRTELSRLRVDDIDMDRMTLMVRQGKGKKDRVVPLGERAMAWVRRYLDHVRPELVTSASEHCLFVGTLGDPMCPGWVTERVRRYVEKSGIGKKGACHLFRHTMATLMLEGGADVRFVQEMLGHATVETTQLYTQVSIQKLREVHAATHPGARLGPAKTRIAMKDDDAAGGVDALFSSLAAEAAEEEDVAS